MFQVEPHVPVRILLDCSASMAAREGSSQLGPARKLAGAMTYVASCAWKPSTSYLWPELADGHVCGGGRHRFAPAADYLESLKAQGHTRFLTCAKEFAARFPQRGLLIVISDFQLGEEDWEKPLQYLADIGHELLLLHVFAPEDRVPPWSGELDVVDAESGEHMQLSLKQRTSALYRTVRRLCARAPRSCPAQRRALHQPEYRLLRRGGRVSPAQPGAGDALLNVLLQSLRGRIPRVVRRGCRPSL